MWKPRYAISKKTTVDGITFASKLEAERYLFLLSLVENGEIRAFQMQVVYTLLEPFDYRGEHVRGVTYAADFVYEYDGMTHIEDTKNSGIQDPAYKLKKKMFLHSIQDDTSLYFTEIYDPAITPEETRTALRDREEYRKATPHQRTLIRRRRGGC